ncbi:MAG TPA: archaeosortase A [Methanothrix sp.]|nr:archaeosortase A [Methanothrix sp.]HPJ84415.1 archaeosortase A [Methanothrix sp.]HPR66894.1 archaeosortase A [Methanothrix sp.]
MIIGWLAANVLWIGLVLLMASALSGRRSLSGLGWILFGVHWLKQPAHYLAIGDHFNVLLTLAVALFCLYVGWIILAKGCRSRSCDWASSAVAVGGFAYFPFAELAPLRNWLINETAELTLLLLRALDVPAVTGGGSVIVLNGHSVEIVLACTAIESMALFAGVVLSVQAPLNRKLAALLASVPVIYALNLIRNIFVVAAYGGEWFGDGSFYLAHNVIAKAGSAVALFAIAYVVFMLLPELLEMIDELASDIRRGGGEPA